MSLPSWSNLISTIPLTCWPLPKATWSVDDLPDHSGKVVLVTGGNTGIGKETAKVLLSRNAKVYLACRSRDKAEKAIADLRSVFPQGDVTFLELDLGDLKSIEKSAKEFLSKEPKLNILYNNAGVMMSPPDITTTDGYDLQFGTNVLGHWYFTQLVMPALLASSTPNEKSRVIMVSSVAAYFTTQIDYRTLKDPNRYKTFTGFLYSQSKLGNVMTASELARQYGDKIVAISVHPGVFQSELYRHTPAFFSNIFLKIFGFSIAHGAMTQLYAGGSREAEHYSGKYMVPYGRIGTMPTNGNNPEKCGQLWAWLEEQVAGRDHV